MMKDDKFVDNGIEGIVNSSTDGSKKGGFTSFIKDYLVDTTSSWVFYTPLLASSEYFLAGMETDEVLKSRLIAIGVHAVISRPYAKLREYLAEKVNADKDSSKLKKLVMDTSISVAVQIPVYSTILGVAGASLKEVAVALPSGLFIGAVTGRPYGYFLDKWRKLYSRKGVLN